MKKIVLYGFAIFICCWVLTDSLRAQGGSGWQNQGQGMYGTFYADYGNIDHLGDELDILTGDSGKVYSGLYSGHWVFTGRYFPTTQNIQAVTGTIVTSPFTDHHNSTDSVSLDTLWAGCAGGYIYFTSNGGTNWTQQVSGTSYNINSLSFVNNQTGWAVGGTLTTSVILHTTNGGTNWSPQNTSYTHGLISVSFVDINHGWACGYYDSVLYTSNGGANWVGRSPSLPVTSVWLSINMMNQDTGWCVGNNGQGQAIALWTTNGGQFWHIGNMSQTPLTLYGVSFANSSTGYAVGSFTSGTGAILKTTDGGSNWASQTLPSNTPTLHAVSCFNGDSVIAVGDNGTILYTSSGGMPIGIKQISNSIPKGFELEQNYPNPFNPSSKIKFQISKLSDIKLKVYDAIGREVATIVDEQLMPGTYEVTWDALNFPSGVYFYKLTTGGFSQTKKMVLTK